jgi:hypothetical protein
MVSTTVLVVSVALMENLDFKWLDLELTTSHFILTAPSVSSNFTPSLKQRSILYQGFP